MWIRMRVPDHPLALNAVLEGLTRVNEAQLLGLAALGERPPLLYASGARYAKKYPGEHWQTALDNLKHEDDTAVCRELAAHRTAELRVWPIFVVPRERLKDTARLLGAALAEGKCLGIPARTVSVRTGKRTFHALTQWPDGRIEDPSLKLGMKPGALRA